MTIYDRDRSPIVRDKHALEVVVLSLVQFIQKTFLM